MGVVSYGQYGRIKSCFDCEKEGVPMKAKRRFWQIDRKLKRVSACLSWISTVCMLSVALVAVVDVVTSKVFNRGIPGATEYITYMLIPIIYLAIAYVQLTDGPVCVDMFYARFSQVGKHIVDVIGNLIAVGVDVYMTRCSVSLTGEMIRLAKRSSTASVSFPLWPFAAIFTLGMGLLALCHLWTMLRVFFSDGEEEQK